MKNEPRIPVTFSLPSKDKWVLEGIDHLAQMDRVSRSKKIRKALMEYLDHHLPGNPQKPLDFSEPTSWPIARIEAGIRFLRTHNDLSYKQIAAITGFSFRQVLKTAYDGKRTKRRKIKGHVLEVYRQKWRLFKRGMSPEEAFKF